MMQRSACCIRQTSVTRGFRSFSFGLCLPVHFTIVSRQIVANQIGPDDSNAYDWSTSICALQWIAPAKDHSSDHNVEFDVSIDLFKNG